MNARQHGQIAYLDWKAVKFSAQQVIQIHQLAPLALPTHPESFARVVDRVAVQHKERPHLFSAILLVQSAYQLSAQIHQRVLFGRLFRRIRKIGEQHEMQIGIMIP